MQAPITVVGFGGTLNPTSTTLVALRRVLSAASELGARTELIDAGTLSLPMYDWGAPSTPEVERFADAFHAADALVWASPLYHGTISGLFKNAIDWLEILADRSPPYLSDKPVGLIGIAGGAQSLQAITSMEQIVRSLRGWTVPLVVPINRASEVFDKMNGGLRDVRVDEQLHALGTELVRAAHMFRRARG
ncbi:MAG: NAD(P)H-dependent oxidoreductase [Polyangiaceae bacterium]|nr:NAD(P)H-dependent oxidoreductase [Polyangiaceae bacterium]